MLANLDHLQAENERLQDRLTKALALLARAEANMIADNIWARCDREQRFKSDERVATVNAIKEFFRA